jgi:predicted transglutaminase-like protease
VETDENGNVRFRVIGRVLPPWRAKIADKLGKTAAAAVTVAGVVYVLDHNLPPVDLLPA